MTSKKVRLELEKQFDCKLVSRKKEIDKMVVDFVNAQEGEGESEDEDDEPLSPKKKKKKADTTEEEVSSDEDKPRKRRAAAPPKKTPRKKAEKGKGMFHIHYCL